MSKACGPLAPILVAFALAGCAGRAEGVMTPTLASAPGTSSVELIVATTRERDPNAARLFSGERARRVSFADVVISIPPDRARRAGEIQWPRSLPADPARDFATVRADVVELPQAQARLRQLLAARRHGRVLVYVHGFNNHFEDAAFGLAQIAHDSRAPAVPVLFTWPSRGELLDYGYDRVSTNYSRDALEAVLASLNGNPAVSEVSILAHSMGNWLTMEALRQMAIRNGRILPKIRHVMLAAPDIDVDEFRAQMNALGPSRPTMTLFASRDDRALAVSRRLWGSTARLGAVDTSIEPYRSDLARDRIEVVDLTGGGGGDPFRHQRFAEIPAVVRSIGARLAAGQSLESREVGIADRIGLAATGAGAAIGGIAGAVVAVPLAVVDPTAGRQATHHLRQAAQGAADVLGAR